MWAWLLSKTGRLGHTGEAGEVNTAAILAWTVLAVVAIAAINVVFGDLVTTVFADVQQKILGITAG